LEERWERVASNTEMSGRGIEYEGRDGVMRADVCGLGLKDWEARGMGAELGSKGEDGESWGEMA
jgi:hypothetical protein